MLTYAGGIYETQNAVSDCPKALALIDFKNKQCLSDSLNFEVIQITAL